MHFTNPRRIRVFLKDRNKKNITKIVKEFFQLYIIKGEMPLYYFKHLYKKGVDNHKDYLSTGEARLIKTSERLHNIGFQPILRNKLIFAMFCERNGLESPRLLCYSFQNVFFENDMGTAINKKSDLILFFQRLFKNTGVESVFLRPFSLNGGKGCFKIDGLDLEKKLESRYFDVLGENYIVTETLHQHTKINSIHHNAINTLRIVTFNDEGTIRIISAFMRIGVGKSVVDNGSSGGLFIGIDHEQGILKKVAYRDLKFGGAEFSHHPDSNFRFEGFQIPFYKEACELAIRGAMKSPDLLIGWDIAITPDRPTIIEGNDQPDLFMSDLTYGGLLQNEVVRKILNIVKS